MRETSPKAANGKNDFQQLQRQFAGHIRDSSIPIIEGIEERRMKIYRDLVFNNIESFVVSTFPVAKSIMASSWWQTAVRDFMADYRCESPYFNSIGAEFLNFVRGVRPPTGEEPDFLWELMHYEWVELALEIDEADPFTNEMDDESFSDNLLDGCPVQSPLAWSLNYRYPVHEIGVHYQPQQAPVTPAWLMVYRDRSDSVEFMVMNALTARLLYLFDQKPTFTGRTALRQIASELDHSDPDKLVQAGSEILQQFYRKGILLGARP